MESYSFSISSWKTRITRVSCGTLREREREADQTDIQQSCTQCIPHHGVHMYTEISPEVQEGQGPHLYQVYPKGLTSISYTVLLLLI